MKKIFTIGLVSAALFAAGKATAYAVQEGYLSSGLNMTATADEAQELTPLTPSLSMSVKVNVEKQRPYTTATITVPTQARDSEYNYIDVATFDKVELTRAESYYADEVPIKVWENVSGGEVLTFDDLDESVIPGKEYYYYARVYLGEKNNLTYKTILLGIKPISPDRPTVQTTDGFTPVTVTYTCPEEMEDHGWYDNPTPFPEGIHYTNVRLCTRDNNGKEVVLDSHDNPQSGQTFTYTDTREGNGTRSYYAVATCNFGESDYAYASVFVGMDIPGKVRNVEAVAVDKTVKITWDPVTEGYNQGTIDPEKVVYTVTRMYSDYGSSDDVVIAENIHECEAIDALQGIDKECTVYYRVTPSNDVEYAGSKPYNYGDTYNGLVVGPANPLPFKETFNSGNKFNKSTDNLWTVDFSYSFNDYYPRTDRDITTGEGTFSITAGVDGGTYEDELGPDAFFLVTPSSWNPSVDPGYITSGKISFEEATYPVFSMYYVPVKGSTGTVDIQFNDGTTDETNNPVWKSVKLLKFDENYELPAVDASAQVSAKAVSANSPWKKMSVAMPELAHTPEVKVRLVFCYNEYGTDGSGRLPMLVDQIEIDDYPSATNLTVTEENDNALHIEWSLPESAGDKKVKYLVYEGEKLLGETEENSYTYTEAEQGESYSFTVVAKYEAGVTAPAGETVEYSVPLVWFKQDGFTYYVNGQEVSVSEYDNSVENITVPSYVEHKGVTYTVTHILPELFRENTTLKSIDIRANVENVTDNMFYGCTSLQTVSLPESVTEIGSRAFFGCVNLGTIDLPSDLTKVGNSAFEHCEAQTEVTFGDKLTEIGARAFNGCKNLAKVTFATQVPPTVGDKAFTGIASPCQGECPKGCESNYAVVENLKPISFLTTGISSVLTDNAVKIEYYTPSGVRINRPVKGEISVARVTLTNGTVRTVKFIAQ